MFRKQFVPMFTPHSLERKTQIEHKVISKRDEEKIKNIRREESKVREMLNQNIEFKNDFVRSQRIMNYQAEKSRLIGVECQIIGNLRFYAPPVKLDDFPDSKDRLDQLEKKMNIDMIHKNNPDFFYHTRYF